MLNKYLQKIAAMLPGVGMLRPVEGLVNRTKQLAARIPKRERAIAMGLSTKSVEPAKLKLEALKRQASNKMWKD